jgi:hypothetical protein
MQVYCPSCAQRMDVPDNMMGKNIFCSSCGSRIQAAGLKTTDTAASAAGGGEETKKCPFCAETILKAARKCKYCKQDLPQGVDVESVRDRLRLKARRAADRALVGAPPRLPSSVGGKFRTVTKVMAGLCALFLTLGVLAIIVANHIDKADRQNEQVVDLQQFLAGETDSATGDVSQQAGTSISHKDDWIAVAVLSFVLLFIFGLILLVVFISDLSVPSFYRRTNPELGFKTFLGGLRFGRFGLAYACLLDGDKDDLVRVRRPIDKAKVCGGDFRFSDLAGFKQYWKGICRSGQGQNRRIVVSNVRWEKTVGNYALVSARVKIESYPSAVLWTIIVSVLLAIILVAVMTKREEMTVTKLMRKVGDQWYVVNGELGSVEDNALELAASLG